MDLKQSHFISLLTLSILHYLLISSTAVETNITTDQSALLTLKTHITSDPYGVLKTWTIVSPVCNWLGVTCGKHHHRVTGLNISNMGLVGSIPPELGNLSFLVSIDISDNSFGTNLPDNMVSLRRLRFINFDHNNFIGEVPSWFSFLPQLQTLSLANNSFTSLKSFFLSSSNNSKLSTFDVSYNPLEGEIPTSIGNLHNLKVLVMAGNRFSGSIPSSLMNMSNLETLDLSENSLRGEIPKVIGNLHMLTSLMMRSNFLIGSIPLNVFNISTLEYISFSFNNLSGSLPNDLCLGLPVLKVLHLSYNQISGRIPSNLSSCHKLQILSLSYNIIKGTIPQEIGSLRMLELLNLAGNRLTGPIPHQIGELQNLRDLSLQKNFLIGIVPLTIFNMSSLQHLNLQRNKFGGSLTGFGNLTKLEALFLGDNSLTGAIPQMFDKLTQLQILDLGLNGLWGPIPSFIFNITPLTVLQLTGNGFLGNLPSNMGTFLPNLEILYLGMNNLTGILPNSISNSSQLKSLELAANKFSGSLPNSLGNLKFLQIFNIPANNFTSESGSSELSFITSLTSCRHLTFLDFSHNPLNGILPVSVGNLSSSLQFFEAGTCKIQGDLPSEIGNLSGLATLHLGYNDLTGVIPSSFDKLSRIQRLVLADNRLTGFIPNELCKLKSLGFLVLAQNQLKGSIVNCLGNVSSLRYIILYSNNLTSGMPTSIWSLQDLLEIDLSSNFITGSLSPQIQNLRAATFIDMSNNQFINDIPNTFGSMQNLLHLSLAYNKFEGPIPNSFGSLLGLSSLDLSHNTLSGIIPKSLESLTQLKYFDVSFNKLSGEIPSNGPFKNFTSQSFAFNTALCGPPRFQVSPCKKLMPRSKRKTILRAIFISLGVTALVSIVIVAFLKVKYRKKQKPATMDNSTTTKPARFSYLELSRSTNGFGDSNFVGKGSFGSVYKGVLEDGTILAIKIFNMQLEAASKTFDAECEVLRNLRHRNLIKVVGCCSNLDFKALVLEYMPHGSLDKWLYSQNCIFDSVQRLDIMIDVASAIEYLHHGYSIPVVHCDLKPSNVPIDENMVAHVSDFGITKFLGEEESIAHTRTLATLGYMAPEYGSEGIVSTKCDVYSYGILLLETFTRKQPLDDMFSGEMSLKSWVKSSLPIALIQVVDSSLIGPEETNFSEKLSCLSSVLELALKCSEDFPGNRMTMEDVLAELKKIKIDLMVQYT